MPRKTRMEADLDLRMNLLEVMAVPEEVMTSGEAAEASGATQVVPQSDAEAVETATPQEAEEVPDMAEDTRVISEVEIATGTETSMTKDPNLEAKASDLAGEGLAVQVAAALARNGAAEDRVVEAEDIEIAITAHLNSKLNQMRQLSMLGKVSSYHPRAKTDQVQ